jgi:hypothetical protein
MMHEPGGGEGSCFFNAAFQALIAPRSMQAVLHRLAGSGHENDDIAGTMFQDLYRADAMTQWYLPTRLLEKFYRLRQEDAAEFLVRFLDPRTRMSLPLRSVDRPRLH